MNKEQVEQIAAQIQKCFPTETGQEMPATINIFREEFEMAILTIRNDEISVYRIYNPTPEFLIPFPQNTTIGFWLSAPPSQSQSMRDYLTDCFIYKPINYLG